VYEPGPDRRWRGTRLASTRRSATERIRSGPRRGGPWAAGADQIKVFADGEVLSAQVADRAKPGQSKFCVEELKAAVDVARPPERM